MTETEPQDAPPRWPDIVGDLNHPFGEITLGALLCAYCAAGNLNAACPIRVREIGNPQRTTLVFAGQMRPLLAAGCWPEKFQIIDASGCWIHPIAITSIGGTLACDFHLQDGYGKLRVR